MFEFFYREFRLQTSIKRHMIPTLFTKKFPELLVKNILDEIVLHDEQAPVTLKGMNFVIPHPSVGHFVKICRVLIPFP